MGYIVYYNLGGMTGEQLIMRPSAGNTATDELELGNPDAGLCKMVRVLLEDSEVVLSGE